MVGEMVTRIDVEILGGHHMAISGGARGEVIADGARQGRPTGHGQRTALAKVVLNVDDDQRAHHTTVSPTGQCPSHCDAATCALHKVVCQTIVQTRVQKVR
jgi:hypothetical protein